MIAALERSGVTTLHKEWPKEHFDYLGREENVLLEVLNSGQLVNGKPMQTGVEHPPTPPRVYS